APSHTALYTLSLHDALPISSSLSHLVMGSAMHWMTLCADCGRPLRVQDRKGQSILCPCCGVPVPTQRPRPAPPPSRPLSRRGKLDRKSTRLNSSHVEISYAI